MELASQNAAFKINPAIKVPFGQVFMIHILL